MAKKQFNENIIIPSAYRLFTTAEVAAILNVSLATVRSWTRKGILPSTSLGTGGLIRISAQDLDEFIRKNSQHKQAEDKADSPLEDQSPQT